MAWIYAGDKAQNVYALTKGALSSYSGSSDLWKASNAFYLGQFSNEFDFTLDEEKTIELGFKGNFDAAKCWVILGPVKLYKYSIEAYASDYTEKRTAALALLANSDYANVQGKERADLKAQTDIESYNTSAEYTAAIQALTELSTAFTNAKASYDALAYENAKALALGADPYEVTSTTTAADAAAAVNTVKVNEYNYVTTAFPYGVDLGEWTSTNATTRTSQHWDGTSSSTYFEQDEGWGSNSWTCSYTQDLTLPAGKYVFKVAGRVSSASAVLTLNVKNGDTVLGTVNDFPTGDTGLGISTDGKTNFSTEGTYANNNVGRGWQWRYVKFELDEEAVVTISVDGSASAQFQWIGFCNPTVQAETELTGALIAYNSALTEAKAAIANEAYVNVTGQEKAAIETAIAADETLDKTSKDAVEAATTALTTATSAFTSAKANYDAFVAYKAETKNVFGEEFTNSVISTAPNTAAECATAVQTLNIAQYNKVATDYQYSLSGLIGDFGSWTGTATVEGAAATPNFLKNEHWSGEEHAYYEQASNGWGSNAWTIQYEKKCTLPAGDYVIKVAARASGDVAGTIKVSATDKTVSLPAASSPGKGINKAGEASWTEGEFANNGNGFGWQWRFLPFTLDEETEVTMTVYGETSKQYNWMSIADGELLSATDVATAVAYDEAKTNTIENVQIANVTMTRTIKEGFNTVVLPFTLTANQVAAAFGTGTEVYAYSESSEDANNVTINFNKGDGSITANVPVLIKATKASTEQTFEGVQVVAAEEATVAGTNFDFVGVYAPMEAIPEGDYFVGNGALYKSAGATSMKAFRAYIKAKSSEARVARFVIGGVETTGVNALEAATAATGKVYNLNGQEVKNAKKGLYIVNGKKVVIK